MYGYTVGSPDTNVRLLFCSGWSNTSGNVNSNIPASNQINFLNLTADPSNNAAGNDFSLNNVVGGGALLRAAGIPGLSSGAYGFPGLSTNAYSDIGAVQSQTSNAILGYARRRKLVYSAF